MRLPDFVIGGAQKSGTTQLHNLLAAHPGVFLPRSPQELHYFDLDPNFERGLDWYAAHFSRAQPDQVVGQTSPLYLFDERVPARMHAVMPDAKLVFVLRDPVGRAQSHYWHQVKKGSEEETLANALSLEESRIAASYGNRRRYSYQSRGLYLEQLERFTTLWPDDRIHIVLFEDLVSAPERVVDGLCTFLGIETAGARCVRDARQQTNRAALPRSRRVQKVVRRIRGFAPRVARVIELANLKPTTYPQMAPEVRAALVERFAGPNEALARRFGLDLSRWAAPPR
ncbi:MAG: sulfotransferase [Alphaproteobacteria bacterium]|nr:sulfotransferase [Alphaproteobacteria bacterium]